MCLPVSRSNFMNRNTLRRTFTGSALMAAITLSLSGCAIDRLLNSSEPLEGTVIDPSLVKTRDGALRVKTAAMVGLVKALTDASVSTAVFTDELTSNNQQGPTQLDARLRSNEFIPGTMLGPSYTNFHVARVTSSQAVTLLKTYGNSQDSASIAESYAIQGQSILYLAEMYCSGIPLTQVPLNGALQYTRGMSTDELFETANSLFDTAITYAGDSIRVSSVAKIGKGRAFLNLGRFSEAKDAVEGVETAYQYSVRYSNLAGGTPFWAMGNTTDTTREVINGEGENGLDWIAIPPATQDPRVPLSAFPHRQLKFGGTSVIFSVAKGAEARMIEAEALLQPASSPSGDWLAPINIARATVGLPALSDPGSAESRVDLLFRERAFWLFLEGRRLGDLRRLVRQYNRHVLSVYPSGIYTRALWRIPSYEANYVFSPISTEEERNPLYSGCDDLKP